MNPYEQVELDAEASAAFHEAIASGKAKAKFKRPILGKTMQQLTPEELDAIEERAAKATPGPWEAFLVEPDNPFSRRSAIVSHRTVDGVAHGRFVTWLSDDGGNADATFVAASRFDVPNLCQSLRAVIAELDAKDAIIAVLQKERDDALSGDEHRMLMAYVKRIQRRHECQPVGGDTWHSMRCSQCKKMMLWSNGDITDLTSVDVDAVRCWNCKHVEDLDGKTGPEILRGRMRTREELEKESCESSPCPREQATRIAELEAENARLQTELRLWEKC